MRCLPWACHACRWSDSHLEYNQDHAVNKLCDWIRQAQFCELFDFPSKGILQVRVWLLVG